MAENASMPKRRRCLRLSLRTFLVLFTVACVALGPWLYQAERQRRAVEWVKLNGGFVVYDYEISDLFLPPEEIELEAIDESEARKWLRSVLGDDYVASVWDVGLRNPELSDISPLADLPKLKRLWLPHTPVEDLSPLSELSELQELDLTRTRITDLTPLSNLTNLKQLRIPENLLLRDISPLATLKSLVLLDISNTQVSDLRPLKSLDNLQSVYLGLTNVPQDQIDALIDRNVDVSYNAYLRPE